VTRAFAQETKTIPIVFTNVSDPLGEKFVQSFAKPGGNLTGFTNIEATMGAKYLQLLKDVAPGVTRAAMLYNPNSAPGGGSYFTDAFEAAAPQFSIQAIRATVQITAWYRKGDFDASKRWRRRSYCCGRTLHECASLQHT
jgi:putative ABC transport system substrate-binding protein